MIHDRAITVRHVAFREGSLDVGELREQSRSIARCRSPSVEGLHLEYASESESDARHSLWVTLELVKAGDEQIPTTDRVHV